MDIQYVEVKDDGYVIDNTIYETNTNTIIQDMKARTMNYIKPKKLRAKPLKKDPSRYENLLK